MDEENSKMVPPELLDLCLRRCVDIEEFQENTHSII
jgi:hypothetical protein